MIKITNGSDVIEVTNGAYETVYKLAGFVPCEVMSDQVNEQEQVPTMSPDEKFEWEVAEKPISSWTKAEIKRFADINGISLKGLKESEARELIAEFLANP